CSGSNIAGVYLSVKPRCWGDACPRGLSFRDAFVAETATQHKAACPTRTHVVARTPLRDELRRGFGGTLPLRGNAPQCLSSALCIERGCHWPRVMEAEKNVDYATGHPHLPGNLQPLSGSSAANQGEESQSHFDERCGRLIAVIRSTGFSYFCRLPERTAAQLLRLWSRGGTG